MKYFMIILLLCIILTGCSQSTEKEVNVTNTATEETEQPNTEDKKNETVMPVTKLDIENYDLEYKEETDAQSFFPWSKVAKTKNGYYLWGVEYYSHYLMFFDAETHKTVPVCNLPNCTHTDDTCNAYFPQGENGKDMIWDYALWYYENYVYILGCDTEDYVNLYRTKLDGSSREKYMQLYKADTSSLENNGAKEYSTPQLIIHRGYVYYVDNKEKNPKLRRVKLGSTETEVLYETGGEFETEGDKPELNYIEGYGDYILFQRSSVFMEEQRDLSGLYAYNIQTGEITFVSSSIERDYSIFDNEIYYCKEKELCKFSIQNQRDEKIMDCPEGITAVSVDRDTISIRSSADNQIRIYDQELNLLYEDKEEDKEEEDNKEDTENGVMDFYRGDEKFLFAMFYEGDLKVKMLDKSKLKDNTAEWEFMY